MPEHLTLSQLVLIAVMVAAALTVLGCLLYVLVVMFYWVRDTIQNHRRD